MSFLKASLVLVFAVSATPCFAQEHPSAPSFDVQLFEDDVLVSQATLQLKEVKEEAMVSNSTSKVSILKDALNTLVKEASRVPNPSNTVSNTTTTSFVKNCRNQKGQVVLTPAPTTEGMVWQLTNLGDKALLSGDFSKLTKMDSFSQDNCFVQLPQKQVFTFSQAFPKDLSNPFVIEGVQNDANYRVTVTPASSTK